ncbi:hypothetical protein ACT691_02045 [Vibrio metschnikovii]
MAFDFGGADADTIGVSLERDLRVKALAARGFINNHF